MAPAALQPPVRPDQFAEPIDVALRRISLTSADQRRRMGVYAGRAIGSAIHIRSGIRISRRGLGDLLLGRLRINDTIPPAETACDRR